LRSSLSYLLVVCSSALAVMKQTILLVAVLASAIAVTTYVPGTGNFAIPIVFGIALSEVKSGSRLVVANDFPYPPHMGPRSILESYIELEATRVRLRSRRDRA